MTDVRAKLAELGLTLPVAAKPVAAYVPAIRTGNIVFTAVNFHSLMVQWLRPAKLEKK